MPFPDNFPYTNFHELNLDYFIKKFNEIFKEWYNLYTEMEDYKNQNLSEAITEWLNEHPETAAYIPDNSITYTKLVNGTLNIYTPEMFNAIGDGIIDDSSAFQTALNNECYLLCKPGATYLIEDTLHIKKNTTINLNGCTLKSTIVHLIYNFVDTDTFTLYNGNGNIYIENGIIDGGSISLIHGENIYFKNIVFKNCLNDHIIELCACKNVYFENCKFIGMTTTATSRKEYINIDNCTHGNFPHLPDGATFDGTIVNGVIIYNCYFDRNGTTMQEAIGKHSYYNNDNPTASQAENIKIHNCTIIGASDCAFYLLGVKNVDICDCDIRNSISGMTLRYSDNVKFTNNKQLGITTQNKISNSNNVYIYNDYIVTGSNVRGYVLSGICNFFEYSYSFFENPFGSMKAIDVITSGTIINDFSCVYDSVILYGTNNNAIMNIPNAGITVNYRNIDKIFLVESTNTAILTFNADITNFRFLHILLSDNTVFSVESRSYNKFAVGNSYKAVIADASDNITAISVTINDTDEIEINGTLKIKSVWASTTT